MSRGSVKIDLSDISEGLVIYLSKKDYQILLERWNPANFKEICGGRYKSDVPGDYKGGLLWKNRSKCICIHHICRYCPLGKRLKLTNMAPSGDVITGEKYHNCFGVEIERKRSGCNYILKLIFGNTSWYKATEWNIIVTDMGKVKQVYDILVNKAGDSR